VSAVERPELIIERKDGTKVTVKPLKAWSPGPWKAQKEPSEIKGKMRHIIYGPSGIEGERAPKFFPVAETNTEYNARLIAAAPELLEAAKYFRSLVDADLLDSLTRAGNKHNDAIAKAEGR